MPVSLPMCGIGSKMYKRFMNWTRGISSMMDLLGIGWPCILWRVYLFVRVRAMLGLPTLTQRLLNKKKEKKAHLSTSVFDAGKKLSTPSSVRYGQEKLPNCSNGKDFACAAKVALNLPDVAGTYNTFNRKKYVLCILTYNLSQTPCVQNRALASTTAACSTTSSWRGAPPDSDWCTPPERYWCRWGFGINTTTRATLNNLYPPDWILCDLLQRHREQHRRLHRPLPRLLLLDVRPLNCQGELE